MLPSCALVVDNPTRDLPGLVLVAYELVQRGISVSLVPMYHLSEVWALAPDFVLLNYLRVNNQEWALQFAEAGIAVGVLDTEGGVFSDLSRYTNTLPKEASARKALRCLLTWGPRLREYLVRHDFFEEAQVVVTGSPRTDFYVERWKGVALASSTVSSTIRQPFILLNGNFPVANPRYQSPEQEAKQLVEMFGFDRDYVARWQATSWDALRAMCRLANDLAETFSDLMFVYRPHPFENLETYKELIPERPNLQLQHQGTIDGWVLRAAAVIQRSCSTAVDAALAGKPALSPRWIPCAVEIPSCEAVSHPVESSRQLTAVLSEIVQGRYQTPAEIHTNLRRIIADWYYAVDGQAHLRVADQIQSYVGCKQRSVVRLSCLQRWVNGSKMRAVKIVTHRLAAHTLRLPRCWSFRQWKPVPPRLEDPAWLKSGKFFGTSDVQHLVNMIAKVRGDSRPPCVVWAHEVDDHFYGAQHSRAISLVPNRNSKGHPPASHESSVTENAALTR